MNTDRAVARQKPNVTADKVIPPSGVLTVDLVFSSDDMHKVKTWYLHARKELGDKFVEDVPLERIIFEAFAGGAVNPAIRNLLFTEVDHG